VYWFGLLTETKIASSGFLGAQLLDRWCTGLDC
jgi:hypothetical protein